MCQGQSHAQQTLNKHLLIPGEVWNHLWSFLRYYTINMKTQPPQRKLGNIAAWKTVSSLSANLTWQRTHETRRLHEDSCSRNGQGPTDFCAGIFHLPSSWLREGGMPGPCPYTQSKPSTIEQRTAKIEMALWQTGSLNVVTFNVISQRGAPTHRGGTLKRSDSSFFLSSFFSVCLFLSFLSSLSVQCDTGGAPPEEFMLVHWMKYTFAFLINPPLSLETTVCLRRLYTWNEERAKPAALGKASIN